MFVCVRECLCSVLQSLLHLCSWSASLTGCWSIMHQFAFRLMKVVVLLLISLASVTAQNCFWPNGNELTTSDNFISCGTDGHSQCCASGHACMSNGLCFNPAKGSVYRGGCTDKNWSTDACPRMCNDMSGTQSSCRSPIKMLMITKILPEAKLR